MSHVKKAKTAWGATIPDWVRALAEEADRSSQNRVAATIGYSAAAVSTVIGHTYSAKDTTAMEQAVRASLMAESVPCPEVGEMPLAQCLTWRRRAGEPFLPLGSVHRTMRDACHHCSLNTGDPHAE